MSRIEKLNENQFIVDKPEPEKRFSATFPTCQDFWVFYNQITDKKTCATMLGVAEIAALLHHSQKTIRHFVSQAPHRVPPRVAGRSDVVWRVMDHFAWASALKTNAPAPAVPAPEIPATVKKRVRGRPRKSPGNT